MMNTNYKIGALDVLLSKDCLSERYYPLIPHKEKLISGLRLLGVETKNDAAALSDEALMRAGLPDDAAVRRTGARYRETVLALGGSMSAREVFRMFRGRDPQVDALLRQQDLV